MTHSFTTTQARRRPDINDVLSMPFLRLCMQSIVGVRPALSDAVNGCVERLLVQYAYITNRS